MKEYNLNKVTERSALLFLLRFIAGLPRARTGRRTEPHTHSGAPRSARSAARGRRPIAKEIW